MSDTEREDPRIDEYKYFKQLMEHLNHDVDVIFNEKEFIFPKQLEIHLPSDHLNPCPLRCSYCAGALYEKPLGRWEMKALHLLDAIGGRVPQHIYGGAYTEPITNPYLTTFIAKTREYGNSFGIHTSGFFLKELQATTKFLNEINTLADNDRKSYLQVSLDAGVSWSWAKVKRTNKKHVFWEIIDSLKEAVEIRERRGGKGHSIRLGYLIEEETASPEQFAIISNLAKEIGVDSLRFSIPFAHYNQSFSKVREYKNKVEIPQEKIYEKWLEPLVSKSKEEKPYIFWNYPWFTDIDRFTFNQCIYSYFQITLGADGYYYPCSTVATPTASHLRLGLISSEIDDFFEIVKKARNPEFDPRSMCFNKGLRCNRMGLECNTIYSLLKNET